MSLWKQSKHLQFASWILSEFCFLDILNFEVKTGDGIAYASLLSITSLHFVILCKSLRFLYIFGFTDLFEFSFVFRIGDNFS